MPLSRIAMRKGKPKAYKHAIMTGIYEALRETFTVPEDDLFMSITEHDDDTFLFRPSYLGIEHSDDMIMIQLTVSNTRTIEQKKALYARIAERLAASPGLRKQDVFINLVEVVTENWSFGNGIAQYAEAAPRPA